MSNYADGFAFPIPRERLTDYRQMAKAVSEIWIEHGAIEYREFSGDDMALEGTRSFADAVGATDDEVVIFGWVMFESREVRDAANEKVASDPRVAEMMGGTDSGFDASRMAYAGFRAFIHTGTR